MTGNTKHNDNVFSYWGNNDDLSIKHNGTDSWIENYTGDLQIVNYADDKDIRFWSDNGSGGVEEYLRLDGGIESLIAYKDLLMAVDGNGGKIKLGASQDLQLFHDGSHSYIDSNNTGDLYIRSLNDDIVIQAFDDVFIYARGGEDGIKVIGDGAVELYHNGTKKFETTSTGVSVTGDIIVPNGKISTIGGNNLTISGTVADHAGISFATNSILPCVVSATNSNVVDLGQSNNVFKNLYLGSEIISGGGATFAGNVSVNNLALPDGHDIGWDGGFSSNKPTLAANGTTMKMYPSGSSGGVQFH